MNDVVFSEDLLKQAVIIAVEEEISELQNAVEKNGHIFSEEFHKKIEDSFQPEKMKLPNVKRRIRLKYLLIAAILMILSSMAVLADDDIREKIGKLVLSFTSVSVDIEEMQNEPNDAEKEFTVYKPQKIPEGYTKIDEQLDNNLYLVEYHNKEEDYILYVQNSTEYSTSISYDAAHGNKHKIKIGEIEAYEISDGKNNSIFFEKEGYLFHLTSNRPYNEILEIAESFNILK